ncbi:nucleotide exchange factor Fes1-domain-containing protein [Blastocladiella britannica]|nr:nucleotide exchange factor Fes1-domain-containing protein [Blastocladiella britannica]
MDAKNSIALNDLLKWGIEHTTASEDAPPTTAPRPEPLDPKWVDIILGKPDAVRMRDCMSAMTAPATDLSARTAAADELEMLVEQIDNAMDLKACKLWSPLFAVQRDMTVEPEMRMYANWIVATAVQNNPKAAKDWQDAGGLDVLVDAVRVRETEDPAVVAKLVAIVSALTSLSPEFIALMHSRGILADLAALLQLSPRHASSKRVLHMLAYLLDAAPKLALLFAAPGWMARAVRVQIEGLVPASISTTTDSAEADEEGDDLGVDMDHLEKALRFVVTVSRALAEPGKSVAAWPMRPDEYRWVQEQAHAAVKRDKDAIEPELVAELDALVAEVYSQ